LNFELFNQLLTQSDQGDYRNIIEVIKTFLEKNTQAEIKVQHLNQNKANLIAIWGNPDFLINCHMDTVPATNEWSFPPYQLTPKDGKLYGLGTCDTKGNIYAVLQAVNQKEPENLMLLFSFDEESGLVDSGVTLFLDSNLKNNIKYALVCEPTELKFVNQHKNYISFDLKVKGESAHSSTQNNQNAIVKSAHLILDLNQALFNIGKIEGGKVGNVAAGECMIRISTRNYLDFSEVKENVINIVKQHQDIEIFDRFTGPPLISPGIKKLPGNYQRVSFWTEASLFQQQGIDTLVYGVGSIQQAHSKNEYIYQDDLKAEIDQFSHIIGVMQ